MTETLYEINRHAASGSLKARIFQIIFLKTENNFDKYQFLVPNFYCLYMPELKLQLFFHSIIHITKECLLFANNIKVKSNFTSFFSSVLCGLKLYDFPPFI